MFREKLTSDPQKRGYLYIRESDYQRDKRTLRRKPAKLGDGSATKQRGRYSKKKDIYCGRIYEVDVQKILTFKEYLNNMGNDHLDFLSKSSFEELIDEFVKYVLFVYEIDESIYFGEKKVVFTIGEGFMSKDIIEWLKRFKIRGIGDTASQMKRFYYRCLDCGIFDEDIINTLYLKIVPDVDRDDIKQEIEELKKMKMKSQEYDDYQDFMKKN